MAATPKYQLPYPVVTDPGDGPTQIGNLAAAVEALLSTGAIVHSGTVDLAAATTTVKASTAAAAPLRRDRILYGPVADVPDVLAEGVAYFGY